MTLWLILFLQFFAGVFCGSAAVHYRIKGQGWEWTLNSMLSAINFAGVVVTAIRMSNTN